MVLPASMMLSAPATGTVLIVAPRDRTGKMSYSHGDGPPSLGLGTGGRVVPISPDYVTAFGENS